MRRHSSRPKFAPQSISFIIGLTAFVLLTLILTPIFREKARKAEGVVSFVIDDWGYNLNNVDIVLDIDRPVTLAVLPRLLYSKEIARKVTGPGSQCDVILHLPLESKSGRSPEPSTIRTSMTKERIISILDRDLVDVPGIIGVSNHQGSRVTENKIIMKVILGELKKKGLFFLDSRTTSVSAAGRVAQDMGLRHAERDIFLDLAEKKTPKQSRAYIKKQIRELVRIAKQKGSAIGIGHDKKVTLETIKESIPEIEKENVKIVPLKKLVR